MLAIIALSCSSTDNSSLLSQQSKIDSLTSILNGRAGAAKDQQKEKEKQARLEALAGERNSFRKKITTTRPSFRPVALGGFKNIEFALFNDYDYPLDQVTVKVHYIRSNGKEIKTETQTLRNVAAHSRKFLTAPDYTRAGTRLTVSVEDAQCRAIDLCYHAGAVAVNGKDAYRCR